MNKSPELPVQFDENGFALGYGRVLVYCASEFTREYIGTKLERTFDGVSLSAGAYLDAPKLPKSDNVAICRSPDGTCWEYVPDYRGKMVYHTQSRQRVAVTHIGKLPPELTLLAPQTPFDKWDGKQWMTDTAAQRQHETQQADDQRQSLLYVAERQIALLERKKRLGMATDTEIALLREWEIYSVELADINLSAAPDIDWPKSPE